MLADGDLYQTDILAWSEKQTGALRESAARRDLPNALDLTDVVEEIEDVGQSELNAVRSFLRLVLGHAIKCWADPDAPRKRHWLAEIGNWQNEVADRLTPSMRNRIDLDALWVRAVRQAALDLAEQDRLSANVTARPTECGGICPVTLDDILVDPADPAALVARLKQGASSLSQARLHRPICGAWTSTSPKTKSAAIRAISCWARWAASARRS